MSDRGTIDPLHDKTTEVATTLRLLANEKRLLALCILASAGEMSVGSLGDAIGLSQSALSQHLARLRADRLVTARRDGKILHYRISDPRVAELLRALDAIYCATGNRSNAPVGATNEA
jgi:ArsR family transcriptional regulator, virulence genes transcriptional regulator